MTETIVEKIARLEMIQDLDKGIEQYEKELAQETEEITWCINDLKSQRSALVREGDNL